MCWLYVSWRKQIAGESVPKVMNCVTRRVVSSLHLGEGTVAVLYSSTHPVSCDPTRGSQFLGVRSICHDRHETIDMRCDASPLLFLGSPIWWWHGCLLSLVERSPECRTGRGRH